MQTLSYTSLLNRAWPFILANMAVPLLGIVDTAIIGHVGTTAELGALAVGGVIFSFIYWGFGFLRMGSSGLIAQASGAKNMEEVKHIVWRSGLLALVLSIIVLISQWPIFRLALALIDAPESVNRLLAPYFYIRIWSAPATLLLYVLSGLLIGLGNSRALFLMQLLLNGLNALLNVLFAGVLSWGIKGIAIGTVIAEYFTLLVLFAFLVRSLRQQGIGILPSWNILFIRKKIHQLLSINGDILLRTFFMLVGFTWFTRTGAKFGETVLAANHVLMQFITFSAFFLDGFAHVVEGIIGQSIGAKSKKTFMLAVQRTCILAAATALVLAAIIYGGGAFFVTQLTTLEGVIEQANIYLPFAAIYVALAVAAFQLDGIFIGASYGSAMRNASFMAVLLFLLSWYLYFYRFDNFGLWYAFIFYVFARALTLGSYFPSLIKRSFTAT